MSAGVEVEVKFRVSDREALIRQLTTLGFHTETERTFERNLLFDTPDHSLRAQRAILRVRSYGSKWVLTHKRLPADYHPDERHKHRIETETEVADGSALISVFENLGYQVAFIYEKWRTELADPHGHCVIDETPIGTFAELEGPEDWIDRTASRLQLAPDALLTLSYGRLFDRWRAENGSPAQHLTFADCAP
jgi:adenylate cyclase, class 2